MEKDSKGFAGQVNTRTAAIALYAYISIYIDIYPSIYVYLSFHAFCDSIQPLPHLPVYWEITFCIGKEHSYKLQIRKGLLGMLLNTSL